MWNRNGQNGCVLCRFSELAKREESVWCFGGKATRGTLGWGKYDADWFELYLNKVIFLYSFSIKGFLLNTAQWIHPLFRIEDNQQRCCCSSLNYCPVPGQPGDIVSPTLSPRPDENVPKHDHTWVKEQRTCAWSALPDYVSLFNGAKLLIWSLPRSHGDTERHKPARLADFRHTNNRIQIGECALRRASELMYLCILVIVM